MKSLIALLSALLLAAFTSGAAVAAGGDDLPVLDLDISDGTIRNLPVHFYGFTLGDAWQGFPSTLIPEYVSTNPAYILDATLPVYIDWEMHVTIGDPADVCPDVVPQSVFPARPLANEAWFSGRHNELIVWEVRQDVSDAEYHTCADGNGLEIPQPNDFGQGPFTSDGKLRVHDIHGGIGNSTIVWGFSPLFDQIGRILEFRIFIFRWNKVDSYTDDVTETLVNALPGTAFRRFFDFIVRNSYGTECQYQMLASVLSVQWPSTDIAGTGPRYTNASDLAHVASKMGQAVNWGFDYQEVKPLGTTTATSRLGGVLRSSSTTLTSRWSGWISDRAADFRRQQPSLRLSEQRSSNGLESGPQTG